MMIGSGQFLPSALMLRAGCCAVPGRSGGGEINCSPPIRLDPLRGRGDTLPCLLGPPGTATQAAGDPGEDPEEVGYRFPVGVARQRDPDVAVGDSAHGGEYMARLLGVGRAGAARRYPEPRLVKLQYQFRAIDVEAGGTVKLW